MRRRLGLALVALLALGCSGGATQDGVTTITFWQFWPSATIQPLLDAFEAANPDVKVELQQLTWQNGREKITASVAAGNPPDLCELGSTWFAKFAANGALVDRTASVADLRDGYLMWDACTYEGQVMAFPWVTGTRAFFYNKDLWRAAGLDPEAPPQTWAELLAAVAAVHKPEQQIYGYGLNSGERYVQFKKFMPFAWGNGGDILSADLSQCTFSAAPVRETLDFYLQLKRSSMLERQEVLDQEFKQGRIGAMISGAWMLKTLARDVPDLDYGVALVPRPAADHGIHASFGGGELLVTFRKSKHPEAAERLARFLIEAPQAMAVARAEQSVLPAAVGASADPFFTENPKQAVFLKQLETAVFPPNLEAWVEIEDLVDSWLEKAVFETVPPQEALDGACREINALLQASP